MSDSTDYQFHKVAAPDEILDGTPLEISVGGWNILVCRYEDRIHAVENKCSHQRRPLTGGRVRKGQIICPVHGARFNLADGAPCSSPAIRSIVTFPVRELDGALEVGTPVQRPDGGALTPTHGPR